MLTLEAYECDRDCKYFGQSETRHVIPAGWWAWCADGSWSRVCVIKWWQTWKLTRLRKLHYWPLRMRWNGLLIWQSEGAMGISNEATAASFPTLEELAWIEAGEVSNG